MTQATVSTGSDAKGITTQTLATVFGAEVKTTRNAIKSALKGGLTAAVYTATLAWFARSQGASRAQIQVLVFGIGEDGKPRSVKDDGGEAKIWRAGMALAQKWSVDGIFGEMIGANSFEAASKAALVHLAGQDVRSVEKLGSWLTGERVAESKPIAERIGKAITSARKKGEFSANDADAIGRLIVNAMGLSLARDFLTSADNALNDLAQREAALADNLARPQAEPTDAELSDA